MKQSKRFFLIGSLCMVAFGVILAVATSSASVSSEIALALVFFTVGVPCIFFAIGSHHRKEEKEWEYFYLSKEEKDEIEADRTIVSVTLIGTNSQSKTKASASSSVARGVVGGALFGPIGAVAGAVTPKRKTVTNETEATFAVKYASGRTQSETVQINGARYKELIKYI